MASYFYEFASQAEAETAAPELFSVDPITNETRLLSQFVEMGRLWHSRPVMGEPDPETGEAETIEEGTPTGAYVILSSEALPDHEARLIQPDGMKGFA
ncbi:MAG: hypothetical protein GC208_09810 [Alphaproteobacteria bacterium]|nr:hypothetical protein [Alphaproteobacteria bacterium]